MAEESDEDPRPRTGVIRDYFGMDKKDLTCITRSGTSGILRLSQTTMGLWDGMDKRSQNWDCQGVTWDPTHVIPWYNGTM